MDATTVEMTAIVVRTMVVVKTIILPATVDGKPVPRDPGQNRQQSFTIRGSGSWAVLQKSYAEGQLNLEVHFELLG